ncbi:MAG TPA: sulfotransferase [Deltaproteobacteria bacterium]|nr:sulfotransferase [Deltaproteobacteria bacterium]
MTVHTQPFFIVSSGRSGTKMFEKLLSGFDDVEIHHEYMICHVQPLAARYAMGLVAADEVVATLRSTHGAAVRYSEKRLWGDSSNKLSWVIPQLCELFPQARFIFVVRDGRKVASSYFNKLGDEIYDDRSVRIMYGHLDDPAKNPPPPPEKRYWWKIPRNGEPMAERFRDFDQFQRIVYHWVEVNRTIERDLAGVDGARQIRLRLEDLVTDRTCLERLLAFLGLHYEERFFEMLKRPHNVSEPVNYPLTGRQREQFWEIAGEAMEHYGYGGTEEYEVRY